MRSNAFLIDLFEQASAADGTVPTTSNGERLSAILKKLFEPHVSGDVTEELVKAAANGDAVRRLNCVLHSSVLTVSICRQNVKSFLLEWDRIQIVRLLLLPMLMVFSLGIPHYKLAVKMVI